MIKFLLSFLFLTTYLYAGEEIKLIQQPSEKKIEIPKITSEEIRQSIFLLSSEDPDKRIEAKNKLIEGKNQTAIYMKFYLKGFRKEFRYACIDILKEIKTNDAQLALAQRAIFDKEQNIRKGSASAINEIHSRVAKQYILDLAMTDNKQMQNKLAKAITNIGDVTYVDGLLSRYDEYVNGRVTVNMKMTNYDATNSRNEVMQRTVNMTPTGSGGGVVGVVDYPIQLPVTQTVEVSTTVNLFCKLTGREEDNKSIEELKSWWNQKKKDFKFPELDK